MWCREQSSSVRKEEEGKKLFPPSTFSWEGRGAVSSSPHSSVSPHIRQSPEFRCGEEREKGLRGEGWEAKRGGRGGITTMAPDASSPRHVREEFACKKCCSGQPAARDRSSVGRRRVFFGEGHSKSAQYTAAVTYEGPCFFGRLPLKHACALCKEENAPFSHNLLFSLAWRESCNNAKLFFCVETVAKHFL